MADLAGTCTTHPDPDLWHSGEPAGRAEARKLCLSCPALAPCTTYALRPENMNGGAFGVWAAMYPRERRSRSREDRRAAVLARADRVRALAAQGLSNSEIARRVGLGIQQVRHYAAA